MRRVAGVLSAIAFLTAGAARAQTPAPPPEISASVATRAGGSAGGRGHSRHRGQRPPSPRPRRTSRTSSPRNSRQMLAPLALYPTLF
jgi:hypothetical protein